MGRIDTSGRVRHLGMLKIALPLRSNAWTCGEEDFRADHLDFNSREGDW